MSLHNKRRISGTESAISSVSDEPPFAFLWFLGQREKRKRVKLDL
jgi:hypothetical protein